MFADKPSSDVRITIITSTLNCAEALDATSESIRVQTHRNVQWIVADGGSNDATVANLSRSGVVTRWFSEPDSGIYDAWNKASKLIDGDWVLFLGAGDCLTTVETLERVATELACLLPDTTIAYGNVTQKISETAQRRYGQVDLDGWDMFRPSLPAHQGVFARSNLFRRPNPFDASYKVAADSKFLLQSISSKTTRYFDIDIAEWELGGASEHPRNTLKVMHELLRLEGDLGYRIPQPKRLIFVGRSYARFLLYKVAGTGAVSFAASAKRFFSRS